MVLSKGFEVELYTGKPSGEIVGLSDRIVADLDGFVREPDSRNVEYTTAPAHHYDPLLCDLLKPRLRLRQYIQALGNYTLIPGSTLAIADHQRFYRSDPHNPYHTYIEQTYGTSVVTASIHINIGIPNIEQLFRACRLVRMEAPLFLALSASSPFLGARVTGHHSTRWAVFPKTPAQVPLFTGHPHFIDWTESQLLQGTMQNVRHLWSSVRPNGNRRPYDLNRLELRICDLVTHPIHLLAITALLEARILQMMEDPQLDPLMGSHVSADLADLVALADANENAAATHSLDAELIHWQDGRRILARDWVDELYTEVWPTAKQSGFSCFLTPIHQILTQGNEAQQWLKQHQQGESIEQIMQDAIATMSQTEIDLRNKLCEPVAV
ncbi:glutamate--cysteine ligase [Acaryochloris sp. IP29b_bin.137]|uniref:glutamate--cysteine ligase n=1 Tax=Acaryochloris sp. IP29b_bin.137 TaxID=2969217 RepID=UPI00261A92BF|nr:glutamate--cysteine ligase [Acaryochloris sp. IP29b_bin.137]